MLAAVDIIETAEYEIPLNIKRRVAADMAELELLTNNPKLSAAMLYPKSVPGYGYPSSFSFSEPYVCQAFLSEEDLRSRIFV